MAIQDDGMMDVTAAHVLEVLRQLGLSARPVCVHASLRSFGLVDGGTRTIVDSLLADGCTILVPTFSSVFAIPPPATRRLSRNGWDADHFPRRTTGLSWRYSPEVNEVDRDMGAIPKAVLAHPAHIRGNHPLNSFTAVGPVAHSLVAGQGPLHVYAPLEALAEAGGSVVLMGVGLDRMTLVHLAEQRAGRRLFRCWANDPDGRSIEVEVGSCSDGFGHLEPVLAPLTTEIVVGRSRWRVLPVGDTVEAVARVIRQNPEVTHCDDPQCARCNDAVRGGPTTLSG